MILGIAAFILLLYAVSVYNAFFEVSHAYVYHPLTDRVYFVVLKPTLSPVDYWGPLIPLKSPKFGDVDYVEYVGQLQVRLKEIEEDQKLSREHPQAWSKSQDLKMEQMLSESGDDEILDLQYYGLWDTTKNVYDFLPKPFAAERKYSDIKPPNVFFADIVVIKHGPKRQPEVEVLREAIFIRGGAAYEFAALLDDYWWQPEILN